MSLDPQLLTQTLHNFFTHNAHLLPNYIPDSTKVSILLWAVKDKPNTFLLKIANQKYLSSYRTDKNGAAYWKFREVERDEEPEPEVPKLAVNSFPQIPKMEVPTCNPTTPLQSFIPDPTNLDPVAKFYQRQTKAEQKYHGKSDSTINHPDQSTPISQ